MRTTADAFPVLGGTCTGGARRCEAKQGRRGRTALTCCTNSHSSTVPGRRRERRKNSLVTMPARFLFVIMLRPSKLWHLVALTAGAAPKRRTFRRREFFRSLFSPGDSSQWKFVQILRRQGLEARFFLHCYGTTKVVP
jgi:hypothetical protein